jgi:hypothetical protein
VTLVVTSTSTGVPFDADASLRDAAIDNANAVRFRDCGQSCGWGL